MSIGVAYVNKIKFYFYGNIYEKTYKKKLAITMLHLWMGGIMKYQGLCAIAK